MLLSNRDQLYQYSKIMTEYYYDDIEFELYNYDSSSEEENETIDPEVWQDWNSEELLNLWMSVVEYHEYWYIPLNRTFNEFCEFIYVSEPPSSVFCVPVPEIQAIKDHPWIRDLDWDYFFSLKYK